jgi:hypothetical protein
MCTSFRVLTLLAASVLAHPVSGFAQAPAPAADEPRFAVEFGFAIDNSINGNVNSGAIGTYNGVATALLPSSYGDVYGTGIQLRFGGAYLLDNLNEVRAIFTFQSADADLVRLGDIGPSSLYAQYSDYHSFGLDLGYRRYLPLENRNLRAFAEASLGAAFVDSINVQFAAPQSNAIFETTDFYDDAAAFTWNIGGGVLFRVTKSLDVSAQIGLRHVGGLPEVDQLTGSGLSDINNDSARLTFPIVAGVRFRF